MAGRFEPLALDAVGPAHIGRVVRVSELRHGYRAEQVSRLAGYERIDGRLNLVYLDVAGGGGANKTLFFSEGATIELYVTD